MSDPYAEIARPVDADPYAAIASPVKPAKPTKQVVQPRAPTSAQARARADAAEQYKRTPRLLDSVFQGQIFGWFDEAQANIAGAVTGIDNFMAERGVPGAPRRGYSAREAKDAHLQVLRERHKSFAEEHPVQDFAGQMAGGMAGPGAAAAGKYIAAAPNMIRATGRSAVVGAGFGGVAGAGAAEGGVGERAKGGAKGAAVGTVIGAATPAAAKAVVGTVKAVPRIVAGGEEAVSRVGQAVGIKPGAAKITPGATRKAEQVVREIAERRGVTVEDLQREVTGQNGKPFTGAETLGREAQTLLMALARRSGRTGDQLGDTLRARAEAAPARVVDDLKRATGRNAGGQFDEVERAKMQMWKDAEPLYREAYEFGNIGSPTLDKLLTRPSMRDAMKRAYAVVREQGDDPESLGLVNVDDMDDWLTAVPQVDKDLERASKVLDRRAGPPNPNKGRGPTLLDYIARNGGIVDDGGELIRMDADRWHLDRPYRPKLIRQPGEAADTADGWAERAWEEGFFPELQERPTPNDLYDAIADELAGRPRFSKQVDPRVADEIARMEQAEARLRQGDDFEYPDPDDYGARPEPQLEPAWRFQPSMQSLDLMKRQLDDMLEAYRDPITRRLQLDEKGRAIAATLGEFKNELIKLNPRYQDALYKGGEAPRVELAWRDGPKLFSERVGLREFGTRWEKMSRADRKAAGGAFMEDLLRRAENKALNIRQLATPAMRKKMELAFGKPATGHFMANIDRELKLLAGQRMSPSAGSPTGEILQAQKEIDQGTGFLSEVERRVDAGSHPISALTASVARTAASPLAGFLRGVQSPYRQGVRDELGRLLQDNDALLQALKNRPPRQNGRYPAGYAVPPAAAYAAPPPADVEVYIEGRPEYGVGRADRPRR